MIKRKIYQELLEWKKYKNDNKIKEALLIKGARQVGKSYIVNKFGKNEYESFIEINFIEHPEYKEAFRVSKNPDDIYSFISLLMPGIKLIPGKTLFFLDEIQNSGDARTALKFLASDLRYDFIASGSLLGLEYGENGDVNVEIPASIPVGYEKVLNLYPLDFEEFLWAKGYKEEHINILKTYFDERKPIPENINDKFDKLFREYIVVGGMPEAVKAFVSSNNFNDAIRVQDKILQDYKDDISKHAKGEEKIKVRACFDSIPRQLNKEFKKFQYSVVEKRKTSKKYGGSVKWLIDSSIVNACYNVSDARIPLIANEKEDQFKLYLLDTGLLTNIYGRETKIGVLNNSLKGNGKGAIYENVFAQLLMAKGYKLNYYHPNDDKEIEFIIEKDGCVIPLEVKAGNNPTKSLNDFISEYEPKYSFKFIYGNIGEKDNKISVPHYMILFI